MRFRSPVVAGLFLVAVALAACGDGGGPSREPAFILSEIVTTQSGTCGVTPGASLYCWGTPPTTFGLCITDCVPQPELVVDSSRLVLHGLASGPWGAVCGLDAIGAPRCGGWLLVDVDQGYAFPDTFAVLASGTTISSLTVGEGHVCGVGAGGVVNCWGDHDGARRGDFGPNRGTGADFVANTVPGGGSFSAIAASFSATCGVETGSQRLLCWGYDSLLGSPSAAVDSSGDHCGFHAPCTPTPVPVESTRLFSTVVSGDAHSCGLEAAGAVYCWGYNFLGQAGSGDTLYAPVPVAVTLPAKAVRLAAGATTTCAILSTGELYCWGSLPGLASMAGAASVTVPTRIPIRQTFVSIALSWSHACGLTASGAAYCWGDNRFGQLGTGAFDSRSKPTPVKPPGPSS